LGVDYIDTRNDKVNAVTLEDISRVADRVLQPENLHFVVVGQPEGLETVTD
jgi:zinc protease